MLALLRRTYQKTKAFKKKKIWAHRDDILLRFFFQMAQKGSTCKSKRDLVQELLLSLLSNSALVINCLRV